jgi:hypothetical protein
MTYRDPNKEKWAVAKGCAKQRGIPFRLTFEEWLAIWTESGKLDQRGWRRGQFVMARPGDKGAYEIGNVVICLAEENRAERNRNYTTKHHRNPWPLFKNPDAAKEKKRQAMIPIAACRKRDARGCFLPTEGLHA